MVLLVRETLIIVDQHKIFTGKTPFDDLAQDVAVMFRILGGQRPARPTQAVASELSNSMWAIMEEAWLKDPEERPSLAQISISFEEVPFTFVTWEEAKDSGWSAPIYPQEKLPYCLFDKRRYIERFDGIRGAGGCHFSGWYAHHTSFQRYFIRSYQHWP